MNPLLIGGIVETVGKVADSLFTSDEERAKAALDAYRAETGRLGGQVEINKTEASSQRLFVAGWRPAIGWICGLAIGYQFLVYPLLVWGWRLAQALHWLDATLQPPPILDIDALWVVVTGMLGLATMRTAEKVKGRA